MRQTHSHAGAGMQQQPRRFMDRQQQQASGGGDYQPRGQHARQMGDDGRIDIGSGDAWQSVPSYKLQGE
ncbi:hypothetical protein ACO2Q9_06060 [Variovorax sp. VNK109]|uniref:hypothetical protein n=1 Tax=Variovorax sp. VNK109 TaxID=3400919 RepID=UPI003C011F3B